jgi:hypothetical protein
LTVAPGGPALAQAISDGEDRLVSADEPLAGLHVRCGGEFPGTIAVPALLECVARARRYGLRMARAIQAQDVDEAITAWVEVEPRSDGPAGCRIILRHWQASPLPPEALIAAQTPRTAIDRDLAELTARLDAEQNVLTVEAEASDLVELASAMRAALGRPWTDFVTIEGSQHRQPMHWRLLDGATLAAPGSTRSWHATLLPLGAPGEDPSGFELCLTSSVPLAAPPPAPPPMTGRPGTRLIGRDIAPVLRQPLARIIANAETIRTRLAGPLAEEYSGYASDIATAGQHLLALIDDLATLEVVEADDFAVARDEIDLADVARQAAGILGVRARERNIALDPPRAGETAPAVAEFRRAMQILLNLIGNAIRYSPPGSQVWVRLESDAGRARAIVADQGPGLDPDQQAKVFEKFERLGRSDDGGTGLGLYISRRLARAMGGELSVESAPGQGARFILELPANPEE